MENMKIIGISGSLRLKSYNTAILSNIKEQFKDKIDLEIINISDIPLFNEDIENDYIESVDTLKKKIASADGVIIASPEYNYSIPGALKNAIDFLSRGNIRPLANKKVALISASLSILGGSRMQYDLRKVLLCLDADVIKKPEIFIPEVNKVVDDNGKIINDKVLEKITLLIEALISNINNNK